MQDPLLEAFRKVEKAKWSYNSSEVAEIINELSLLYRDSGTTTIVRVYLASAISSLYGQLKMSSEQKEWAKAFQMEKATALRERDGKA